LVAGADIQEYAEHADGFRCPHSIDGMPTGCEWINQPHVNITIICEKLGLACTDYNNPLHNFTLPEQIPFCCRVGVACDGLIECPAW
jgi:hypothetical protein